MSRKRWAELNADLKQIERLTNAHRGELVNPSFQNTEEILHKLEVLFDLKDSFDIILEEMKDTIYKERGNE